MKREIVWGVAVTAPLQKGAADKKLKRNLRYDAPRTMYCWDVCGGQMP